MGSRDHRRDLSRSSKLLLTHSFSPQGAFQRKNFCYWRTHSSSSKSYQPSWKKKKVQSTMLMNSAVMRPNPGPLVYSQHFITSNTRSGPRSGSSDLQWGSRWRRSHSQKLLKQASRCRNMLIWQQASGSVSCQCKHGTFALKQETTPPSTQSKSNQTLLLAPCPNTLNPFSYSVHTRTSLIHDCLNHLQILYTKLSWVLLLILFFYQVLLFPVQRADVIRNITCSCLNKY